MILNPESNICYWSPRKLLILSQNKSFCPTLACTTPTISKEACKPINLLKQEDYWFSNYPIGITNRNTDNIVGIDEAHYKLTSQDCKYGKSTTNKHVDSKGMYKKGASAITLNLSISESKHNQFAFAQQYDEDTTDLVQFYTYMCDFIDILAENGPGQSFCFTMDEVNIHKRPVI